MSTEHRAYTFRSYYIPARMWGAIEEYIHRGLPPGHFLTAVIENDLTEAVSRADEENMANLPAYCAFFFNETPAECWGSAEKRVTWMRLREQARRAEEENP